MIVPCGFFMRKCRRRCLPLLLLVSLWDLALGQLRYSVSEEVEPGTFVGNIAKDLGLDLVLLNSRGLKLVSGAAKQPFQVNMNSGLLLTNARIDREEMCAQSPSCKLVSEIVIDNPLEMHRLEVDIVDVNDNAPSFVDSEITLSIFESASPASRFPVQKAVDPDSGTSALKGYTLSANDHFHLNVLTDSDNRKSPELVLKAALDRERAPTHNLILTAFDGGDPRRSGTLQIHLIVQDANDNAPTFDQLVYHVTLLENVSVGTTVVQLHATDLDEGPNGDVMYYFSKPVPEGVRRTFSIDADSGVITVQAAIDFEETREFEILAEAQDRGSFAIPGHCKVLVEIIDVNDNTPCITITSQTLSVAEDAKPGTVIALLIVSDKDSGENGNTSCSLPPGLPFVLENTFNNHHSLVLRGYLDRESVQHYEVTLSAVDGGSPPLSASTVISVRVSDVNDNCPKFTQPSYSLHLWENNVPGAQVFAISAADPDLKENGHITYSLVGDIVRGGFVSINSENGKIFAMKSFDYEEIKHFRFQVQGKDAGVPPLSSNVSVDVFILDQNDNAPEILPSYHQTHSLGGEVIPRSVEPGYLVSKIRAVDADSGYNAWLLYQTQPSKDSSLFKVGLYTGEIRTSRPIRESDAANHRFIVVVKDHGEPALSITVSVMISLSDSSTIDINSKLSKETDNTFYTSDTNLYLVISIAFVSFIFLAIVITFVALKIHKANNMLASDSLQHCAAGVGSLCYFENSYKVCMRNSGNGTLVATGVYPVLSENSTSEMNRLPVEGAKPRNIDDLLMIGDDQVSQCSSLHTHPSNIF
ncbi:hypothetical protein NDU88_006433 [Pleurodeles waltl]|uniref:Cadherin domain-containing protein n=1 Tax=Pleurodeles waltl TaxID=8319 RepID=A0AAV7PLE9_PLEWA|nr:hypothetical protein NDU88_006433 [Pleurodeles waltl]